MDKYIINNSYSNYNTLITRILDNSYNYQDLNLFVNLCSSISAAYLKNELFYNRLYFPIINKDDNDLKDISLDLIAPLFKRDESNNFKLLNKYLLFQYNRNVEGSLYNRLKSIIISKTKQELIERFKEEEPGGYKILRNIKLAPNRHNKIKTFDDQFNTYFYHFKEECQEPVINHLKANLPKIEQDELLELARIACKKDTTMPTILEYILINIQKNNTYRDFVEISSLFKALKTVMLFKTVPLDKNFDNNRYSNKQNGEEYNSHIFHELYEYVVLAVKKKYFNTNKINEETTRVYISILEEYYKDRIIANIRKQLPHYLNNGYSKLIAKKNLTYHQVRIEYLIKIGNKKLLQIISKY